jgi:LmbE family N-acetylglucosaminyl deacetylase
LSLRLLCITAHPDDEAGAFGGALLMSAEAGVETSVVCLTAGAAGNYREPGQSDAELATIRRAEFQAAAGALGVRDGVVLDYGDGELAGEPFWPLVATLVGQIRRRRPHVVLTFGADGGVNLHPDHTVTSLAATAAFHWAGRRELPGGLEAEGEPWAPQKLYWSETPFVSSRDEELARHAARVPASLRLDLGAWKEGKYRAFAMHSSQRGVLERVRAEHEEAMGEEGYLLVAGTGAALWDGVVGE